MNELQIFENSRFGKVRTVNIDGKPYFVVSDVAKALDCAKPQNAIAAHCKGALKQGIGVSEMDIPTNGGIRQKLHMER